MFSRRPAAGETPVIISVTTHGPRLAKLWVTLECVAGGEARPQRIIVWLDRELEGRTLPSSLLRLKARGVELRFVEDLGPHKKYYYAALEFGGGDLPLVTIDDDVVYPRWWLRVLFAAHRERPDIIHCFRARRLTFSDDGSLAPYPRWPFLTASGPSPCVFSVGVSGVLYPVHFVRLVANESESKPFLRSCPRADDIWLNYLAAKHRVHVAQVLPATQFFPSVIGTQENGLWANNATGGNDQQIRATYDAPTLRRLGAECRGETFDGPISGTATEPRPLNAGTATEEFLS